MKLACRPGCGACCIAPSISSAIPGQPAGKPAGVRCPQLTDQARCRLFDDPERPRVCGQLQPSAEMCGSSRDAAMQWLAALEAATQPLSNEVQVAASVSGLQALQERQTLQLQ